MAIARILAGLILVFLGRRLFWFVVGLLGFIAGISFAPQLFENQPGWVLLVVAIVAGLLGALLALLLQRFAIALAGFVSGGYLLVRLVDLLGMVGNESLYWIPFLIGGVIGAALTVLVFDWALIVLTSLAGASLVVQTLLWGQPAEALLFIALAIVGVGVQAGILLRDRRRAAPRVEAEEPFPTE